MTPSKLLVLAIVLSLAVGAAAGGVALLADRPPPAATSRVATDDPMRVALADYDARLERLDRALQQEREQRAALAAELAELRRRVARSTAESTAERHARAAGSTGTTVAGAGAADETEEPRRPGDLDVEAMVAAGFPAAEVQAFKEKLDQLELDRLYLRDLAAREGWLDTPRFREEDVGRDVAVQQAREEYGDEFYDWMLYASGHPNRVRVGEVLAGSAAAEAGLRPGDLILSYDEQRVFSPVELRDATSTGTAGDATRISVLRDGRPVQVVVPRGPLGVRIGFATEEPPPAG